MSYKDACEFVSKHHRHHKPPQGYKFAIGAEVDGELIGVVIVGRPVGRHDDDGWTCEVTRLCTDGTKNACSFLYRAAWRTAKNMGYTKLITFILETESGDSLKAAGFVFEGKSGGKSWSVKSRLRDYNPQIAMFKKRYYIKIDKHEL